MEININPRTNGACPICVYNEKCGIKNALKESVKNMGNKDSLEIVIYTCPKFREKA